MQQTNKFFEDIAKMTTSAAGMMMDLKREIEQMIASQMDKWVSSERFVSREEFEVVREMAAKAREENEKLAKKLTELEKKLTTKPASNPKVAKKPVGKSAK